MAKETLPFRFLQWALARRHHFHIEVLGNGTTLVYMNGKILQEVRPGETFDVTLRSTLDIRPTQYEVANKYLNLGREELR